MSFRQRALAAVIGFGLATGCTGQPGLQAAEEARSGISEQIFAVGYDRIAEIYLNPVDMGKLALDGLSGLSSLDRSLRAERHADKLVLLRDGTRIAEFDAPAAGDTAAWAALTARAVGRARGLSERLQAVHPEEVYQAVFDAIMADLDTYSRYTGMHKANAERAQREGYGGVGLGIDGKDGRYAVAEVLPHSPAARSGIRVGDRLTAVDGESTRHMTLDDVRERLRGPTGTQVLLSVATGNDRARQVALHRDRVIPNTVSLAFDGNVAILKVDRFNAATALNLREAVEAARSRLDGRLAGIVLDLRGNPGGLLDQAVAVSDLFIPKGRIISTAGRHPDSNQRFDATSDDVSGGTPLVVVLDGRSASAAEIVAAALQDSGRAIVVGASSYGKGSVQTVTRLPNDGELFLTWSRLYAPSGYTLHLQGVTPTVCTSRDQNDAQQVIAELRDGLQTPPSSFLNWKATAPENAEALAALRGLCPWKSHHEALDLQVAKMLLGDRPLYQRAMQMSSTSLAER